MVWLFCSFLFLLIFKISYIWCYFELNNLSDSVDDNSNEELDNLAIKFVSNLENRGIDLIIDVKDIWFSLIGAKDRDKMVLVFDKMIDILGTDHHGYVARLKSSVKALGNDPDKLEVKLLALFNSLTVTPNLLAIE